MEVIDEEVPLTHKRREPGLADQALNLCGLNRCEAYGCIAGTIVLLVIFVVVFVYAEPLISSGFGLLGDLEGGAGAVIGGIENGLDRAFTDIETVGTELECAIEEILDIGQCPAASKLPCCQSILSNVLASYIGRNILNFCTIKGTGTACTTPTSCITRLGFPQTTPCSQDIIRLSSPVGSCDNIAIRQVVDCAVSPQDKGTWLIDTKLFVGASDPIQSLCCSQWKTSAIVAGISRGYTSFCVSDTYRPSCAVGYTCENQVKLPSWFDVDVKPFEYVITPALLTCDSLRLDIIRNGVLINTTSNKAWINPATGQPFNGV